MLCCLQIYFGLCLLCFKQKTACEMRISDWSSDVCSADLRPASIVIAKGWTSSSDASSRTNIAGGASATPRPAAAAEAISAELSKIGLRSIGAATPAAATVGRASCRERACQHGDIAVVDVA